jgi:hypothetical protein
VEETVTLSASEIKARLDELAREEQQAQLPPHIEQRVLHAWDERSATSSGHAVRRSSSWRWASLAATLLVGVCTALISLNRQPASEQGVASTLRESDVYLQWLDDDPASLQVVRLRATVGALASMGVVLVGVDTEAPIEVEVIIGPDGGRRSARLIRPSLREEF